MIEWVQSTEHLKTFLLPRPYFPGISWEDISHLEVHGYSDASELAYGAVVYLRIQIGDRYLVSFAAAKGRAAPIKRIILQRLELMSALLCSRFVSAVVIDLELNSSKKTFSCHYWTDSLVSWHWIRTDPFKLKTFLSNRVSSIQNLSSPASWQHCPGSSNPADILSRG